jgi:GTP-binding protein HflX
VALVGYTNAGKSTLFNNLTGASVLAKDMLFATLDPTMRAVDLPDGRRVILSDTVGFISDLPTQLVAAFRATLEEVLDADLILHVRDIAHPESSIQAENVKSILGQLGVNDEARDRIIEVWNKIDLLSAEDRDALLQVAGRAPDAYAISALSGQGVDTLLRAVETRLEEPATDETLTLAFADGRRRAWLFDRKLVTSETQTEDGYEMRVHWTERDRNRYMAIPSVN